MEIIRDNQIIQQLETQNVDLWQKVSIKMDIYKILRISNKDSMYIVKHQMRKIMSEKMTLYERKEYALASQILRKKKFYNKGEEPQLGVQQYQFKEDIFHYATTCDFPKLIKSLQEKPEFIIELDENENSLLYLACQPGFYVLVQYLLTKGININQQNIYGSTALHVASFYGHTQIVEILLLNGADFTIKNKFGKTPYEEGNNLQVKQLIKNHCLLYEQDQILKDIKILRDQNLITVASRIYIQDKDQKQNYVGIFIKINYYNNLQEFKKLQNYLQNPDDWVQAYHGTKSKFAPGIIKGGFVKPSKRGDLPLDGHIKLNIKVNGIENWADACFFSQSMYMACHDVYAEGIHIKIPKLNLSQTSYLQFKNDMYDEKYKFVFQVMIKKNNFTEHKHTLSKYEKQNDEPDALEWRVENEDDILITGVYYVRDNILQQYKSHLQAKYSFNEEARFQGVHINQENTLKVRTQNYISLCLQGHRLNKTQDNNRKCDVCNNKNKEFLECNKCDFARCHICYKEKKLM